MCYPAPHFTLRRCVSVPKSYYNHGKDYYIWSKDTSLVVLQVSSRGCMSCMNVCVSHSCVFVCGLCCLCVLGGAAGEQLCEHWRMLAITHHHPLSPIIITLFTHHRSSPTPLLITPTLPQPGETDVAGSTPSCDAYVLLYAYFCAGLLFGMGLLLYFR